MNVNEKQIIKNIAVILSHNPAKVSQLEKITDICFHLTSDDGIDIDCEIYAGDIARYLITGTRCRMTITANTITNEITRKPYKARPIYTARIHTNTSYIFAALEHMSK